MAGIEGEPDITTPLGFLGLTSISAIKLAVQLSKKYGVSLNAKEMVKTGTIQSVENEILAVMLSGGAAPAAEPAKQEAAVSRTFGLSAPQQGVYVDCLKNPASTIYRGDPARRETHPRRLCRGGSRPPRHSGLCGGQGLVRRDLRLLRHFLGGRTRPRGH